MPRKGPAPRRPLVADPVYQSPLVTQLVNKVLVDGKRSVVVVLPASMCAMIPMLRVLASWASLLAIPHSSVLRVRVRTSGGGPDSSAGRGCWLRPAWCDYQR